MLRSQGWEPGQYLGAKGASHSEFFTSANASHIRAVLKDDNMGLGARRNQGDECTGLDALQELLGRLNGKSEETLDTERKKREDTKMNKYLHRKLGTMRFVFGGYLVGDKVQELADDLKREKEGAKAEEEESADISDANDGRKEKKSKKRKTKDDDGIISEKKKEKKSKKRKTDDAEDDTKSKRKDKKDKKKKTKDDDSASESKAEPEFRDDEESKADGAEEDTSIRKKSKKDKKDKRKKSKDEDDVESADASESQSRKKKKRKSEKEGTESSKSSALPTESSTPTASGTSTPVSDVPHRHLARKRFIAQKRAAVMDPAALKQVRHNIPYAPQDYATIPTDIVIDLHDQSLNTRTFQQR